MTTIRRFRKKPLETTAVQFREDQSVPDGVHSGASGFYVTTVHNQRVYLEYGDWVLPEPDGKHYYPVKNEIFQKTYTEIEQFVTGLVTGVPLVKLDAKVYGHIYREKDGTLILPDRYVVFMAHDRAFLSTLRFYRGECARMNCEPPQLDAVDDLIVRVQDWQLRHPEAMKLADVDPGELNVTTREVAPETPAFSEKLARLQQITQNLVTQRVEQLQTFGITLNGVIWRAGAAANNLAWPEVGQANLTEEQCLATLEGLYET